MFCNKCGKKSVDGCKFCTYCGYNFSESSIIKTTNTLKEQQEEMKLQMQSQQLQMQKAQIQMQAEQLRVQQEQFNAQLRCPKCGSTSISGNKKGFGVVKGGLGAVVGTAIFPGIGTAIGAGAGNFGGKKVICTCMNCGKRFKAGKSK